MSAATPRHTHAIPTWISELAGLEPTREKDKLVAEPERTSIGTAHMAWFCTGCYPAWLWGLVCDTERYRQIQRERD